MGEAEDAKLELLEKHQALKGKVCITVTQSLIIAGFGDYFSRFQKKYPNIKLHLITCGQHEYLVEKGIDLAIRIDQLEDFTLNYQKLFDCTFQVVAAPSYLKRHGTPSHPGELTRHNCLIYSESISSQRWLFISLCGEPIFT